MKQSPESKFCPSHGGNMMGDAAAQIRVKGYLLAKYNHRAAEFSDQMDLKGLRGEVGILRMLLETKLNVCATPVQLAIQAPGLSDLIMKVQKLVVSCHKLEESLGQTMDEQQLLLIADSICGVLSEYITDEEQLKQIAGKIGQVICESTRSAQ